MGTTGTWGIQQENIDLQEVAGMFCMPYLDSVFVTKSVSEHAICPCRCPQSNGIRRITLQANRRKSATEGQKLINVLETLIFEVQ